MEEATRQDEASNRAQKPALARLKLCGKVKEYCASELFTERAMEERFFDVASHWIEPLPDKTLPNAVIRTTILQILERLSDIQPDPESVTTRMADAIENTTLGKQVRFLANHPHETAENRIVANKIFQVSLS